MNWAYVAGFFDAEGSIGFRDRSLGSPVHLILSNTNKIVIDEIKKFIDAGNIYVPYFGNTHFGKKEIYTLQIYAIKDVKRILENVVSFSMVKREKIIKGLEILDSEKCYNEPQINWSYIAGFFDGDGCISLQNRGNLWIVSLINNDKKALEKMLDFMEFGKIYLHGNAGSYFLKIHKMADVLKFIKNIIDTSIIQKPKLANALSNLESREWHPNYKLKHIPKQKLKENVIRMYNEEQLSLRKIAKKLGVSYNAVYHHFDKFGISKRTYSEAGKLVPSRRLTEETKRKMSEAMKKRWKNNREKMLKNLENARLIFRQIRKK